MGINRYHNGAWTEISGFKSRVDGAWKTAELRRHDGKAWELLWPCHFTMTFEYPLQSFVVTMGKTSPAQIASDCLVTGSSNGNASVYIRDSLLFFSVEKMAAELAGKQLLGASLKLKRKPNSGYDGNSTVYLMIGCALSGVDPTRSDNTWARNYTCLIDKEIPFSFGQTRSIAIDTSGVTALLNGKADCLCLPTTSMYTYNTEGFGKYDPAQTVLTVTCYS